MSNRKFWKWKDKIKNETESDVGEESKRTLFFNGTIAEESWFDDDITPQIFKEELNKSNDDIDIWINSPGGDCVAAAQIYNMLMEYKGHITVKVDGIAASAASVIAMAGDVVMMSPVSMLMIHNPMTVAIGDSSEMLKAKDMLNSVKESIINAYEKKTSLNRNKISNLMDAETWMDVNKAIQLGFCDGLLERNKKENSNSSKTYQDINLNTNSMLFSRKSVTNSLNEKIRERIRKENEMPVTTVYDRLNNLKNNWRN